MYFKYTIFQGRNLFRGTVKLNARRLCFAVANCFGVPFTTAWGYIKPIIKKFDDTTIYASKNPQEKEIITTIFSFLALNDKFQVNRGKLYGNNRFDFYSNQNPNLNFSCEISLSQTKIVDSSRYTGYYDCSRNELYLGKPISFGQLMIIQSMRDNIKKK